MFSLRVMVKNSRGKKTQDEREKYVIVAENKLFKGFTAEVVRNYD